MAPDPLAAAVDSEVAALGIIGGGVMGEAVIAAVTASGTVDRSRVVVGEVSGERRRLLRERHGVRATEHNAAAARAELIVLAVKPQQLRGVLAELRGRIRADAVVLSIVAGACLAALREGLAHPQVVRAIPNTPARIAMSATFWVASPGMSEAALRRARALLGALGAEERVDNEAEVDRATGLAGPMPAFVFLLVEAFIDAGVSLGLSRDHAALATVESMRGSLELLRRTGEAPVALREQVTSPGGATLAGLRALDGAGVRTAMAAAVRAVYERARELGRLAAAPDDDT